jgi:hypothetical protein
MGLGPGLGFRSENLPTLVGTTLEPRRRPPCAERSGAGGAVFAVHVAECSVWDANTKQTNTRTSHTIDYDYPHHHPPVILNSQRVPSLINTDGSARGYNINNYYI